jgi:type II secretory pathway pseudopilin PulG
MKKSAGFTLVELVVSIGIIVLISSMILFNAPKFNRTMALNRAAREVASTLRLAQARATQVRAVNGVFPTNYGVQFNTGSSGDEFILFSDSELCPGGSNNHYDVACAAEKDTATTFRLGGGIKISKLDGQSLSAICDGSTIYSSLNVLFFRPDPSIKVTCGPNKNIPTEGAFRIYVKSPDGELPEKEVHVWLTGQISVKQ